MSLKRKLFLVFGSLMALLMLTQWWLVRRISANTVEEFANATLAITRQMVEFFNQQMPADRKAGEMVRVIRMEDSEMVERFSQVEALSRIPPPERTGEDASDFGIHPVPSPAAPSEAGKEVSTARIEARFELRKKPDFNGLPGEDSDSNRLSLMVAGPGVEKEISVSSEQLQKSLGRFRTQLFLGSSLILVAGLAGAGLLANRISRPLRELSIAAAEIAGGNWGRQVKSSGSAEMETAIDGFNRMSRELEGYARAKEAWQQEQHLSELGEVARSLAHTIRNPLNALGLCLEELAGRAPDAGDSEELVRAGRMQIQRIDQWIRSFLSLAIQSETLVEEVGWQPLLEDIVLELAQSGSQCEVRVDPELSHLPPIVGIEAEIRGMLQALLTNAVEASPVGSPVAVRGRVAESRVLIEVLDQGEGIPGEIRAKLFAPHATTKASGSGMGLYLTRQIAVTRYQGNLELADHPPRGTLARLTLSLKRGRA